MLHSDTITSGRPGKMATPVIVLLSYVSLLALTHGIFVTAERNDFSNDHLLRDVSPQDEAFDAGCCENNLDLQAIPAHALLEVSHLTSAQFTEKFTPKQEDIQILTVAPDMGGVFSEGIVGQTSEEGAAPVDVPVGSFAMKFQNTPAMHLPVPVDHFVPIENHHPGDPKIARPELLSTNFRMAKLIDEPVTEPPMAENARCVPRETVVPMPKPRNISHVIWPECTTVKQCGGCCGNSNLLCKPTKTSLISRKGYNLAYVNGKLQIVESAVVTLTEHSECACQCRQNASDCNSNQRYEPGNCRCVCLNQDMATNCGPTRVWDPERCQCKCPNIGGTCPIGFYFDHTHYCSCLSSSTVRQSKISRVKKAQPLVPAAAIYQNRQMDAARRSRSDRG